MFDFANYYKDRFKVEVSFPLPNDEYYNYDPMDKEAISNVFPVDAYGRVSDVISRILETDSMLERNQLLGLLEDTSSNVGSEFRKLKDSEKLALLKPRSMQSLSELKRFGEYLENFIEENNLDVDTPKDPSNEPSSDEPSSNEPSASE